MKKARFLPRILVLFLVFLALEFAMFRFAYHHYKNVAAWSVPDSREVLMYEGEVYYLAGEIGDPGLSSKKYPTDELLGEIKPESFFKKADPMLVWNVKEKENFLIVAVEDDVELLYYHEDIDNPAETETVEG